MMKVFAQTATIGSIDKDVLPFFGNIGLLTARLVFIAFVAAGIFFLIQLLLGGISWINSGGDPKSLDTARGRVTNAVIGIVIVVAAFAIAVIVTNILNINIFGEGGALIVP